jgi:hypothetical protein
MLSWLRSAMSELKIVEKLFQGLRHFGEVLRPPWVDWSRLVVATRMAGIGVRRDKAALSSGCKAHPAIRSSRKQSEQSWR